jgi:hypothetical protein
MKPQKAVWPKAPTKWIENEVLYVSVPFTWNIPGLIEEIRVPSPFWSRVVVGGPAVKLMPHLFRDMPHIVIRDTYLGVLQKVNPLATKTSTGCVRKCAFCAVRKIEGNFKELDYWPDLPILTDNNLLASSREHFDRVIDRLKVWGWCDFNQGIDSRLLTPYHALRIAEIKHPIVKLGFDDLNYAKEWEIAIDMLLQAGISKSYLRILTLIGFNTGPEEAWERCRFIQSKGLHPSPMWFHPLDAMEERAITPQQKELGWTNAERVKITGYFYAGKGVETRPYVQSIIAKQKYWYFDDLDTPPRRLPKE